MEILQNFYGNFYERKPSNILKRAEVDEIQTAVKQKETIYCNKIYTERLLDLLDVVCFSD